MTWVNLWASGTTIICCRSPADNYLPTTWCHNPENMNCHCYKNSKFHINSDITFPRGNENTKMFLHLSDIPHFWYRSYGHGDIFIYFIVHCFVTASPCQTVTEAAIHWKVMWNVGPCSFKWLMLDGPQSWMLWSREKSSPARNQTLAIEPVGHCYTDWAILALQTNEYSSMKF
jgi:hypothetical protein